MTEAAQANKDRLDAVNQLVNGLGSSLLTLTSGDWDLALSAALGLFASVIAQAAVEKGEDVERLFDEIGAPTRAAVLAFYKTFKAADDAASEEDGEHVE